ncbi:hypothetical protein HPP92_017800 [Vanilla planifolia]|uniref:non-specific serine/threonine protein kinase n=1 Tax=Vanilla planifolia TaxID=51239 RepID=A0A835Q4L9_VANPL|nr:hypothetical protein HPP92_017800 [Vanilla planifolia]
MHFRKSSEVQATAALLIGGLLVSLAARQLINGLLQREPANRLGSNGGANEIKQHIFFREIQWPLIRCMNPPELDVPLQLISKDTNSEAQDAVS